MATFSTKFKIGDIVSWERNKENKLVITAIFIDAHQIQYNCKPVNQQFASSYFFESDLIAEQQ